MLDSLFLMVTAVLVKKYLMFMQQKTCTLLLLCRSEITKIVLHSLNVKFQEIEMSY